MNWITTHDQKTRRTLTHDIGKHGTSVSTWLGLISSVYHDLHPWISNQRPQIAELKHYNWANRPYRTEVTSNQLVIVIAWPINLNMSCKLHPYSLQRTWSLPGPRLPKRIRNTHRRNYYDFKGKDSYLIQLDWLNINSSHTVKWFQVWLFSSNNFRKYQKFVYTQLKVLKHWYLMQIVWLNIISSHTVKWLQE